MRLFVTAILLFISLHLFTQEFTLEERNYISENKEIYYGFDPFWKPLEFMDEGEHVGVSRDFLSLIEEKTGIQFIQHPEIHAWSDTKRLFGTKEIKLISSIAVNEEREKYIDFTDAYMSFPFVIVTRNDSKYYGSMKSLKGKIVAAPTGYFISTLMEKDHTEFELIYKETIEECLMSVATNETQATVANLCVASHFLNYRGFKNLQIAAPTHYPEMVTRMGVQKGDTILQSILNKAIEQISIKESNVIMNKWVSIPYNEWVPISTIVKYGAISLGGFLIVLTVVIYWNRTLKKEVVARKAAEIELQKSFDEIKEQKNIIEAHNREITDSIKICEAHSISYSSP